MLQNATHLRKWAPWPPNISHEHVFCIAPATENASLQILFKSPTPAIVFGNATKPSRFTHFCDKVAESLAPATQNWHLNIRPSVFNIWWLWNQCASCHNSLQLFRHLTFQKRAPKLSVFCTFWLRNVLRATTAYTFSNISTSKSCFERGVFRAFLTILTSKCASRHNWVLFHPTSSQLAPHPPLDNFQKRSNSVRLRQVLNLTTSKTKLFCETSSIFQVSKQCETCFKNGKLSAELTASNQCVLRFFHSISLNYCACHEKVMSGQRSAAHVTQHHLSRKPEDLMLQNATPLRKSAPWPPNISDEHVSCTAPATENASLQILFKCPTPAIVFGNATKPSRFAHFWQGAESLAPATQNDIWTSKSGPNMWCFNILTWKCASRHKLFRHLNFQKQPLKHVMCFVTFWLGNVLRATTACTFSTSQLPKVLRAEVLCTFWLGNVLRATTACTFSTSQLPKVFRTWVFCTFWLRHVLRATTACNF